MNRYEKIAWFNLAVFAVSVVLYFTLFFFLRTKYDFFLSAQVATSAFALIAICAFSPLMFNRKRREPAVINGERDTMTRRKIRWRRYLFFWGAYVIVFIVTWLWVKYVRHGTISDEVNVLLIFFTVGMCGMLAFILYLYLKRQKESSLVADEQNVSDVMLFGPDMDERDLMISRNARWCGFGIFWFFYVFGFIGAWGWLRYMGYRSISVDVSVLPLFVFGAIILIFAVDSITKVILYRRGK